MYKGAVWYVEELFDQYKGAVWCVKGLFGVWCVKEMCGVLSSSSFM